MKLYKITSINITNEHISRISLVNVGERDNNGVLEVAPEVIESNIRNNAWKVINTNMKSIKSVEDIDIKEMMLMGKARRTYEDSKGNTVKDYYKESKDSDVIKIENRSIKTNADTIDFDEINRLYKGCKVSCTITEICCNNKSVTIKGRSLSNNICINEPEHIESIDISRLKGNGCLVEIISNVNRLNIGSTDSTKRGIRGIQIDGSIQEMHVKIYRHCKLIRIEYTGERLSIGRIIVQGKADDIISTLRNIGIVVQWYSMNGLNELRIAYIEDEIEIDIRELELYMMIEESNLKAIEADKIEGNLVIIAKEEQINGKGITVEEKNKQSERARKLGIRINGYTIVNG